MTRSKCIASNHSSQGSSPPTAAGSFVACNNLNANNTAGHARATTSTGAARRDAHDKSAGVAV
jgi:hypothetical protein